MCPIVKSRFNVVSRVVHTRRAVDTPRRRRRGFYRVLSITCAISLGAAAALSVGAAGAGEPRARRVHRGRGLIADMRAGKDLLETVPTIAVFDGSWSLTLQLSTILTNRAWSTPYPGGLVSHFTTRFLYGTTWVAMLGVESLLAVTATGADFDWIGEAHYRTDWAVGLLAPGSAAASAPASPGVGGFGGLHVRFARTRWWYEVSGGWIQQRVANDERRTLAESTWIMTPAAIAREVSVGGGPLEVRARGGPGVYFGMHNAHVHPTVTGARTLSVPWHELYPLDWGLGPGGRVEARAIFFGRASLDAEIVVAPLLIGGVDARPRADVAPLDGPRGGTPVFRSAALGVSYEDPSTPMRVGLSYFTTELSGRPVVDMGHRAVMLRFDFPLRADLIRR
jgi:hypothetical protein